MTTSRFTIDDIKDALSTRSRFTMDDIKDALSTCSQLNNFTWNTNGLTDYLTFDYSQMTDADKTKTQSASKVINSKVLGSNDQALMNWNTALFTNSGNSNMNSIFGGYWDNTPPITEWNSDLSSLTNGVEMFYYTAIASFNGDLSSLTDGTWMFTGCTKLTSFNSDLSSLTNGEKMFQYCSTLESFNSDLSSMTNGYRMFFRTALTSFNSDLSSLTNGYSMFNSCSALTSFNSDLSSLTDGTNMFKYCSALTSFNSDLSSLTSGYMMFYKSALESFDSDLSSLTNGYYMFSNTALTSFNSDLSSMTNGSGMFSNTPLTSFNSNLSSLNTGKTMFSGCSSLTSFNSDLSSLTNGGYMFYNCILDTASVQNIASTINNLSDDTDDGNYGWGEIHIGIDNSTPNTEEETSFNTIKNKGWSVFVNGSSWTSTDGGTGVSTGSLVDDEENTIPISYWAKPVEVDEEHATFVSSDGKYYIIQGAQFLYVSDPETYGQFTSPSHAEQEICLAFNLTKYVKPTEEETV